MSSDDQLLHHMYHVPQQSRREKLRFPLDNSLHNSMIPQLPPSSSSNFLSHYSNYEAFPAVQGQPFSLSLSSAPSASSSATVPRQQQLCTRLTPLGPFTGYAAVLSRSRFVEPTRKLLDEVCDVGDRLRVGDSSVDVMFDADDISGFQAGFDEIFNSELQWRRTRLISLHDEVYKQYKQYYQQVQAVIASFESVAGLSTAAPYASIALKTMTKHFRCLKNIIVAQLRQTNKVGKEGTSKEGISSLALLDGNCLQRIASNSTAFGQPHVWRPQRGLPERAVAVLRAWLFEHFLHPYPTDTDKQMLAKQTGLTRNQVSNWFINARVRLWKPMVEEIHTLDMRQKSKTITAEHDQNCGEQTQVLASSNSALFNYQQPEIATTSKDHCMITNNIQKELSQTSNVVQEPLNYEYVGFYNHHHCAGNDQGFGTGGNSGVSLTLGLKQNNGICFPEQLSLNVARRFGLEDCSDTYLMSSFGGQDRQFGKDVGSRLLHDFVG